MPEIEPTKFDIKKYSRGDILSVAVGTRPIRIRSNETFHFNLSTNPPPSYRFSLPTFYRLLTSGVLLLFALVSQATGVSLNVGVLLLLLLAGFLARRDVPRRRRALRLAVPAALVLIFLGGFVFARAERTEASTTWEPSRLTAPLASIVDERILRGVDLAMTYPTNGYWGLGLSMSEPWSWSGGYGGSRAATFYLEKLGILLLDRRR